MKEFTRILAPYEGPKNPELIIHPLCANISERLTGIKRSEKQVDKFLKKIGLKRRKVGMVPSKADIDEQENFKKKL